MNKQSFFFKQARSVHGQSRRACRRALQCRGDITRSPISSGPTGRTCPALSNAAFDAAGRRYFLKPVISASKRCSLSRIEVIRYPLSTKKYLRQPNHLAEVQNGRETPTLPRRREYHRALGCIATIDRLFCCTNAWKVRQKCRRVNDRNTDCILDTMKVVAGTTQLLKTPSHRALRPRSGTRRARRQRTGHTKATSRFGTQGRYCQACLCQKSHGI